MSCGDEVEIQKSMAYSEKVIVSDSEQTLDRGHQEEIIAYTTFTQWIVLGTLGLDSLPSKPTGNGEVLCHSFCRY